MPAKKNNVRKSTSKATGKSSNFKFKWWMGLGLVVVVALIGVLVVRFSNAAAVALVYGSGCNRVNLRHDTTKGASTVNVCQLATGNNSANVFVITTINPGKPSKYCVWGRFYTASGKTRVTMNLYNNGVIVGSNNPDITASQNNPEILKGSERPAWDADGGVRGYGTTFSVSGGNERLACASTKTNSITKVELHANQADASPTLLFLDQITVQ